eukprot:m.90318 g.90318  ORF g.90318 m.90318 type:complete len:390 (-) comp13261_c1_seq3:134-1303(-)
MRSFSYSFVLPLFCNFVVCTSGLDISGGPSFVWSRNVSLTEPRSELAAAGYGSTILFAGGKSVNNEPTNTVEVFDMSHNSPNRKVLSLSEPKMFDGGQNVAATCRGRAYIAGGTTVNGTKSDTVDVFDFASGKFVETLHLSTGRSFLATASLETAGLVFFAGGEMKEDEKNPKNSADADVVDIYSVEEGKFITPAKLSVPRKKLSATTLMDRWVIVAGGFLSGNGSQGYRAEVDVYDSKTNQWSQTKLFRGRMRLASASAGSCSVFAGGEVNVSQGDGSGIMDIFCADENGNLHHDIGELSVRRYELASANVGGYVLFGGGNIGVGGSDLNGASRVDVGDAMLQKWSKMELPVGRDRLAAAVSEGTKEVCWGGGGTTTVVNCMKLTSSY